ncbi:MAG: potassium transporter TrkA [Candidatus Tectimicrobiota bacterium]|nr:MAG: potassium transporter TrkA [Candidatus Tectomicrobia bacterium]
MKSQAFPWQRVPPLLRRLFPAGRFRWRPRLSLGRYRVALALLGALVVLGALGYHLLEGMSALDALYMTVITLSTVGFGEVVPLSPPGRVFTIGLIILGVGAVAWAATSLAEVFFAEQLHHALWRYRMQHAIDRLSGHYIICGYGRMGQQIGLELQRRGLPFVVIDRDEGVLEALQASGVLHVQGDATLDRTLLAAGVQRAKGLATALTSDADNALVIISAKGLNPLLQVVARASSQEVEGKFLRAGADRVVTPYTIGGQRMALSLLQPAVNDFLTSVVFDAAKQTELGELVVQPHSPFAGRSLRQSRLREEWGAIVVAIKRADGELLLSPGADTVLKPGDQVIVVAEVKRLRALQAL